MPLKYFSNNLQVYVLLYILVDIDHYLHSLISTNKQFINFKKCIIMTNYQESVRKMASATELFLLNNNLITVLLPDFQKYFTSIQSLNEQLAATGVKQEAEKKSDASIKRSKRIALVAECMDVARRTIAFAMNANNETVHKQLNYSESDLIKSSDTKFVGICQVIHDIVKAYVEKLAPYGITAEVLATLQTNINTYNSSIAKERVDITDGGASTQLISSLIKSLVSTFGKIDVLVEMVKVSHPEFYNEYQKVRKVIDTGSSSLTVKGLVTDVLNGSPIKGATLTFVRNEDSSKSKMGSVSQEPFIKMSADKGGFNIKSLPEGMYTVTVSKIGYADQYVTIAVAHGELTELRVELAKA